MLEQIRVLIADHHPIFRQGLATVLHAQEDMQLVAMASDGAECVEKARELRPQVVVLA